jgi:hypothetical protein
MVEDGDIETRDVELLFLDGLWCSINHSVNMGLRQISSTEN